ncbi:MAG: hypothetical protein K9M99_03350 [Candidatus Cloacimonetes bacterium]|nr:hypothetical protein [Candidatus Cloacimonadota bacterium]
MDIKYHSDPQKNELKKLQMIASSLNKYSLNYLLQLSSFLSFISSYEEEIGNFSQYRFFDYSFIEMFCKAILLSKSRNYKEKILDSKIFCKIHDKLREVNIHYIADCDEEVNINKLLSIVSNTQCHHQQKNFFIEFGRQLMVYKIIPEKYKLNKKEDWIDFISIFEEKIQVNFELYFLYNAYLFVFCLDRGKKLIQQLNKFKVDAAKIVDFFNQVIYINSTNFSIDTSKAFEDIKRKTGFNGDYLTTFFSIDISEIKNLVRIKDYDRLISDWQPFRNKSLIKIENGNFIIPSLYDYKLRMLDVIPTYINSQEKPILKGIFTELGYCYEKYVLNYFAEKIPNIIIIPERNFNSSNLGPDIVIVDRSKNILIAIEIKSKHIKLNSRHNPSNEEKNGLIDISLTEMRNLNEKIKKIFRYEGDYKEYQSAISSCKIENSFSLVICADYGFFIDKEIWERYSENNDHINYNYIFMDIPRIENVIEYTAHHNKLISDSLQTYMDILVKNEPKTSVEEYFRNFDIKNSLIYQIFNNFMKSFD